MNVEVAQSSLTPKAHYPCPVYGQLVVEEREAELHCSKMNNPMKLCKQVEHQAARTHSALRARQMCCFQMAPLVGSFVEPH